MNNVSNPDDESIGRPAEWGGERHTTPGDSAANAVNRVVDHKAVPDEPSAPVTRADYVKIDASADAPALQAPNED